jgi:cytochrome c556
MRCSRRATTRTWAWPIDGRLLAAAGVVVATGLAWAAADSLARAAAPPEADKVAVFMRAKLAHADHVLEGLAIEDYEMIERAAQELSLASLDSNWQVLQTEDYVRQSAEFRRSCDALKKAAQEKNLDGATLAWVEVTLKCVQCHKYVRDAE